MTAIVISYRREDTQGTTGRIFDRLESVYGSGHVFMDIDNIPFGTDFRHHLQDTLNRCDILLVVVGPRWHGRNASGEARLFEEADWVRLEVATALKNNIPVIPVLVEGARMPKPSELPADLENFAYRQAAVIDIGVDFRVHMERLTKSMDRILSSRSSGEVRLPSQEAVARDVSASIFEAGSRTEHDALPVRASIATPTSALEQKTPSGAVQDTPMKSADAWTNSDQTAQAKPEQLSLHETVLPPNADARSTSDEESSHNPLQGFTGAYRKSDISEDDCSEPTHQPSDLTPEPPVADQLIIPGEQPEEEKGANFTEASRSLAGEPSDGQSRIALRDLLSQTSVGETAKPSTTIKQSQASSSPTSRFAAYRMPLAFAAAIFCIALVDVIRTQLSDETPRQVSSAASPLSTAAPSPTPSTLPPLPTAPPKPMPSTLPPISGCDVFKAARGSGNREVALLIADNPKGIDAAWPARDVIDANGFRVSYDERISLNSAYYNFDRIGSPDFFVFCGPSSAFVKQARQQGIIR